MIEAASTGSLGEVCVNTAGFKSLPTGVALDPRRYDAARQKVDMTAMVLQNLGAGEATRRNGELQDVENGCIDDVRCAKRLHDMSIRRFFSYFFTKGLFFLPISSLFVLRSGVVKP